MNCYTLSYIKTIIASNYSMLDISIRYIRLISDRIDILYRVGLIDYVDPIDLNDQRVLIHLNDQCMPLYVMVRQLWYRGEGSPACSYMSRCDTSCGHDVHMQVTIYRGGLCDDMARCGM